MKYKKCSICKLNKPLLEFYKDKQKQDGLRPSCKQCDSNTCKNYYINNESKIRAYRKKIKKKMKHYQKEYRESHKKERKEYYKQIKKYTPWKKILDGIKQRCNNPRVERYKNYGGRGIKCLITAEELKTLWFRDKAYEMKRPSIDRIDNDGNYCF